MEMMIINTLKRCLILNDLLVEIFDIVLRSTISFIFLFLASRFMGKKQITQLNFFDYVVGISIGSIGAAMAVDDDIEYLSGLVSLVVYAIFPVVMSIITLKSIKWRRFFAGTPTILIQHGKILEKNLRKTRIHVNDILEECRIYGVYNLADIEFVILEPSGKLSFQLKSAKQQIKREDLDLPAKPVGLPAIVIIDGVVLEKHLQAMKLDYKWLVEELKKQNIQSTKEVLLATYGLDGLLYIDKKDHDIDTLDVLY